MLIKSGQLLRCEPTKELHAWMTLRLLRQCSLIFASTGDKEVGPLLAGEGRDDVLDALNLLQPADEQEIGPRVRRRSCGLRRDVGQEIGDDFHLAQEAKGTGACPG